ncbi:hypothetical protein DXG01_009353 [Tephrocybe rancida]|nr:hypothetical protein DXG01_009353 [Tephrocybe rancida]
MAPFTKLFITLVLAAFQLDVQAAPLEARAGLGNFVQCNVARLKTVSGLAATTSAVKKLSLVSSDDATASGVSTAQAGLKDAQTGIATIAKALIAGKAPPAAARDQVGQGLNTAQTALAGISSTDPAITAQVAGAQKKLAQTISAGQQVVDTCGGSGAAGTSLSSIATASMTATEITTASSAAATASASLEANLASVASDTATATDATIASVASLTASASDSLLTACATASTVTSTVTVTVHS